MSDLLFVLLAVAFFALAIAYIYGCQYFIRDDTKTTVVAHIETTNERTANHSTGA